jgi:hypothetical protein
MYERTSSCRQHSNGMVRPTPKPKIKAPEKPSVTELRSLFVTIQKAPEHKVVDLLSMALLWWDKAFPYIQFRYAKKGMPLAAATAFSNSKLSLASAHNSKTDKDKIHFLGVTLKHYARYAYSILRTPPVDLYLKKQKVVAKKHAVITKVLQRKHDKTLTLLQQAMPSCFYTFKPVIQNDSGTHIRFDHIGKFAYFSREYIVALKKRIFAEGLLPVIIEIAPYVARGMSYESFGNGQFVYDVNKFWTSYSHLMIGFVEFCKSKDAPKTLVRRPKNKKIKA